MDNEVTRRDVLRSASLAGIGAAGLGAGVPLENQHRSHPRGVVLRRVRVGEVVLNVALAGHGQPVVLLHGWPQTWFAWRKVIPRLADRYTVIAPDLRGLGASSRPASGYDKRTLAGDIRGLVHALGFGDQRIRLVGHDWGGMVVVTPDRNAPRATSGTRPRYPLEVTI